MNRVQRKFDSKDPKYFFCCGRYHVMTGAKKLAWIVTLSVAVGAIYLIAELFAGADEVFDRLYRPILLISVVAVGPLWYGLLKERHQFLLPILISLALNISYFNSAVVVAFTIVLINIEEGYETLAAWCPQFAQYAGLMAVFIWLFSIYKNAYYYIKHKRQSLSSVTIANQEMDRIYIVGKSRAMA
uniref:Uncharacterized protein n=1 Tax=Plectus sambesii TaxID=2011161 RepID=A0A914X498_9BILA